MPIHSKEKLEKFKKTCEDVVRGESCTFSTCEDCPFYRNNNGYGVSCSEIIGVGYSSASPYAKKFLEGKIVFYEGGLVGVEDEEGETTTTKKYEFTGETTTHYGRTLHRIRRLKDGLIGGWLEKEDNLSHYGDCFVYDSAKVCGNTRIFGDAQVYNNALVSDDAWIYGNTRIFGDAQVCDKAKVSDDAWVCEDALVCGKAKVFGDAVVRGDAEVFGEVLVCDKAKVFGGARVFEGALVSESAQVYDNTSVYGNAQVFGDAKVYGVAKIFGSAEIFGNAKISEGEISSGGYGQ